jgi:phytanoyl-CoA hydroxylase
MAIDQKNILSEQQVHEFIRDGYIVLPGLLTADVIANCIQITDEHKTSQVPPFELEADVSYPGAPKSRQSEGGKTIRRLLDAYTRNNCFANIAAKTEVLNAIQQLLRSDEVYLNPNHHNCVMTKEPAYSSQTNWHRDTRYWSFNNKYLINAWFALGSEQQENGGMLVLPGSHRWEVENDALDAAQFLRDDHESNKARLSLAKNIDLNAGDCLLFSAHCFHAAGKNVTHLSKYSLVFTYHGDMTQSLPNSKSSRRDSIRLI